MSNNQVIVELEQKIVVLEAVLASALEDNRIWEHIFTENYWGMVVVDADSGEFLKMNIRYAEMHGYSVVELTNKSINDLFAPEYQKDLPEIYQRAQERGRYAFNSIHVKKNGIYFPVHIDIYAVTVNNRQLRIVSVWDITEYELKYQGLSRYHEFARSERLNMMGEMAAGVAHEVRNPLTTVRGFLQLLASKDSTKQYHYYYSLMIEELDRANLIIADFLNLVSDKSSKFKSINITKIVRSLSPLILADALNQDKEICLELEEVSDILGDENELRQLILNLVRNGFEAMPSRKILTIKTFSMEKDIILRICDQGGGIDPAILAKLGTPFLTTKERGTGLGLAISKSIAAHHNAEINFQSSSTGTIVTVKFAVGKTVDCLETKREENGCLVN